MRSPSPSKAIPKSRLFSATARRRSARLRSSVGQGLSAGRNSDATRRRSRARMPAEGRCSMSALTLRITETEEAHADAALLALSKLRDMLVRRSEKHTSELQSLMRISYAVFCLKNKTQNRQQYTTQHHNYHI